MGVGSSNAARDAMLRAALLLEEMKDISRVSLAAIGNFVVAGTASALDKTSQIAHLFLTAGQIGVAIITVVYIWKKIKAMRKNPK